MTPTTRLGREKKKRKQNHRIKSTSSSARFFFIFLGPRDWELGKGKELATPSPTSSLRGSAPSLSRRGMEYFPGREGAVIARLSSRPHKGEEGRDLASRISTTNVPGTSQRLPFVTCVTRGAVSVFCSQTNVAYRTPLPLHEFSAIRACFSITCSERPSPTTATHTKCR